MTKTRHRRTKDADEVKTLDPGVIQFCHMVARILARSAGRSSHQADNRPEELKDDPGMVTKH